MEATLPWPPVPAFCLSGFAGAGADQRWMGTGSVLQEPVGEGREGGDPATSPGPAQPPPGCVTAGSHDLSELGWHQL